MATTVHGFDSHPTPPHSPPPTRRRPKARHKPLTLGPQLGYPVARQVDLPGSVCAHRYTARLPWGSGSRVTLPRVHNLGLPCSGHTPTQLADPASRKCVPPGVAQMGDPVAPQLAPRPCDFSVPMPTKSPTPERRCSTNRSPGSPCTEPPAIPQIGYPVSRVPPPSESIETCHLDFPALPGLSLTHLVCLSPRPWLSCLPQSSYPGALGFESWPLGPR